MKSARITRREFLHSATLTTATIALAACAKAAPEPTKSPEKVSQPTAAPTKLAATATLAKAETQAPVPAKYKEAPMLAELVKQGKLPPVEKRLPDNPVVVKPTRTIGKYGGTGHSLGISPTVSHDLQNVSVMGLYRFNDDLSEMTPNVATGHEYSADYKTCTVYLRKGLKWSDGQPFTADDMIFYFEDIQFDPQYSPIISRNWTPGGKPMKVTKLDDYTVKFEFAAPYPAFPLLHKNSPPFSAWYPRHYVKQFHPKYNPKADEEAKAAGFQNWQARFAKIVDWYTPGAPVLNPWVCVQSSPTRQDFERNPYFLEVDTEGNQLPYIDRWQVEIAQNLEVFNLKAMSGEVSIAGLNLKLANLPVLKQNEQKGNYRVVMTNMEEGADFAFAFNQLHPDPVLRELFCNVKFRQAISLAVNRQEINEIVYLGMGTPRQATINSSAQFFKKEWAEAFAQYDPATANKMLDELGLNKRGPDGIRLRPDGKPLSFLIEFVDQEGPKKEVCELVSKQVRAAVGVDMVAKQVDKGFLQTRNNAQQQDVCSWHCNRELERAAWVEGWLGSKLGTGGSDCLTYAKAWKDWLQSDGKAGVKPPQEALDMTAAYDRWQSYPFGSTEYIKAGIEVHDWIMKTLYVIGTVGEAAFPIIVHNNLENVFSDDIISGKKRFWFGASSWFLFPTHATQWFLKNV